MTGKSVIGNVCAVAIAPDNAKMFISSVAHGDASAVVSAAPEKKWLAGDIAPGWSLSRPILLNIEVDDDNEYIVTDSFSTVYGNGRTSKNAVKDYCNSLIGYYELLDEHQGDNVPTAVVFYNMRKYLVKSDTATT